MVALLVLGCSSGDDEGSEAGAGVGPGGGGGASATTTGADAGVTGASSSEGTTPTAESLARVYGALPDGAAVLLITDGQPNGCGQSLDEPAAQAEVIATVAGAARDGVKTHALGLTLADAGTLGMHLQEVAQAGGTGDARLPHDRATLDQALRAVTDSLCP
jgi:hypothetical protein